MKTIGIVEVALFAASAAGVPLGHDHVDLAADEIGGQCGQPIIVALRPAVFDRHVLSLDIAGFAQSLAERGHKRCRSGRASRVLRKPITGIAFCCARAASGHPPIAPASKIMKSRRLMPSPSIWPRAGIMAQQRPYPITLDERRLATQLSRSDHRERQVRGMKSGSPAKPEAAVGSVSGRSLGSWAVDHLDRPANGRGTSSNMRPVDSTPAVPAIEQHRLHPPPSTAGAH